MRSLFGATQTKEYERNNDYRSDLRPLVQSRGRRLSNNSQALASNRGSQKLRTCSLMFSTVKGRM